MNRRREEGEGDSEDDISMDSDDIAAFCSDHDKDDNMDDDVASSKIEKSLSINEELQYVYWDDREYDRSRRIGQQ